MENEQSPKKVEISELEAFGIDNTEHYLIKKVNLDITPHRDTELLKTSQRVIVSDTLVALLYLVKANYGLTFLRDKNYKEHFFIDEYGFTTELINNRFITHQNDKKFIKSQPIYRSQLAQVFVSCSREIPTKDLPFHQDALIDVVTRFNECMGCDYLCYFEKEKDKTQISFGAGIALNSEIKNFRHRNYFVSIDTKYSTFFSQGVSPHLNVLVGLPRNLFRSKILLESNFHSEKISSPEQDYSLQLNFINFLGMYRKSVGPKVGKGPQLGLGIQTRFRLPAETTLVFEELDKFYLQIVGDFIYDASPLEFFLRCKLHVQTREYMYEYRKIAEVRDTFSYFPINIRAGLTYYFVRKEK